MSGQKVLICSGKTFYHHATLEFINHRKYHVTLDYNLDSILNVQLIIHLKEKDVADQHMKATKLGTTSVGGMTLTLQPGIKATEKSQWITPGMEKVDKDCQESTGSWSHPVRKAQGIK